MTREESITLIKSAQLMLINPTDNEPISDLYTALDMAIQALSQEPCDDAISREAAINIASLHCLTIDETVKALEQLPSVTQKSESELIKDLIEQPAKVYIDKTDYQQGYIDGVNQMVKELKAERQKSGKWLYKEITDDYRVTGQCSECKERRIIDNYCPNCGARMESEE